MTKKQATQMFNEEVWPGILPPVRALGRPCASRGMEQLDRRAPQGRADHLSSVRHLDDPEDDPSSQHPLGPRPNKV